jgi:hypothetical protein
MRTYFLLFNVVHHTSKHPPALVLFIQYFLVTFYSPSSVVFYRPASQQLPPGGCVLSLLAVDEVANIASGFEVSWSTVQV